MGKFFFRIPGHFKNVFWGLKVTKNWEFWVWYLWKFNVEFSTPPQKGRKMMLKKIFLVFFKLFLELRYGSRNFKKQILLFYRSTIEIWSAVNGHIEELVIIWLPEDDYPSPMRWTTYTILYGRDFFYRTSQTTQRMFS